MKVQPHLNFDGRCEEALDFYRRALGAEVTALMRFKDSPEPAMILPGSENKVMYSSFRVGDAIMLAADGRCQGQTNFQGISLALTVPNEAAAEQRFGALSDGGQVQIPLAETFFAPRFGIVADRFGVTWTVLVQINVARWLLHPILASGGFWKHK